MKSGIYQIRNLINNKIYIGSAEHLKARWRLHKCQLNNKKHHCIYLQNAWNKYCIENFVFEILERCVLQDLILREQHYLDVLKPEYNICKIAGSCKGVKRSLETREKIRKLKTGLTHTKETKLKISLVKTGIPVHTEESKRKISIASTGRIISEESRRKSSEAQKGKILSPSHLANVRKSREKIVKPVIQINPDTMEIIAEFNSMREAGRLTNTFESGISACARGVLKTSNGFIWKYK